MTQLRSRRGRWSVVAALAALLAFQAVAPAHADDRRIAHSIAIDQPILPRSEGVLRNAIDDAHAADAELLIVRLDTPGGTSESMRAMVRTMLDAPWPVVVYVHPSGGRADSAGLMLTLAADVAAMAPATNIGSATLVRAGLPARNADEARQLQALDRKATNSTVAFARSLAEEHSRNADLAERMIRDAVNASATRAHSAGLVDVVADSEQALLAKLDGFTIRGRKARTLRTAGLTIRRQDVATAAPVAEASADEGSFLRSLLLIGGGAMTIVLVAVGSSRGRRAVRRRQRRRRAQRRQRERGITE